MQRELVRKALKSMGERKIADIARKMSAEDYLHKVMEILEAEF